MTSPSKNNQFHRLALGTVKFGMNYGLINSRQLAEQQVEQILDYAFQHQVRTLDTAPAYGSSEQVIGQWLKKLSPADRRQIFITSKLESRDFEDVVAACQRSIKNLNLSVLPGLLVHQFQPDKLTKVAQALRKVKELGLVNKIGFSIYYPSELEFIIDQHLPLDIIQFPLNIFDQRFISYLPILKAMGTEIHCRSVFLQGLLLTDSQHLNPYFKTVQEKIAKVHSLAAQHHLTPAALCLRFVLQQPLIDKTVLGVDSVSQVREQVEIAQMKVDKALEKTLINLKQLAESNEHIIIPSFWKNL